VNDFTRRRGHGPGGERQGRPATDESTGYATSREPSLRQSRSGVISSQFEGREAKADSRKTRMIRKKDGLKWKTKKNKLVSRGDARVAASKICGQVPERDLTA